MILSDTDILALLKTGDLVIEPFDPDAVQSASVDFHLGTHFLQIDANAMDIMRLDAEISYKEIDADEITIPPHSFLLGTTQEYVKLPTNLTSFVEGRSSIGRMGLFIQNAGWIDPGFEGRVTLELYNANSLPIRLKAGRRICQFVFAKTQSPSTNPYKGKYLGQEKTIGSKIFKDVEVGS